MKNINEMTDEELALSYIDGNNGAFDLLLSSCPAIKPSSIHIYCLWCTTVTELKIFSRRPS